MSNPDFAAAWLRQRQAGAVAVAAVEAAELAALGDAEALRQADALLSAMSAGAIADARRTTSGFVDQQRLFAKRR